MHILHVLSQFEITGAETYAAALAHEQILSGHAVTIASDTFHVPSEAEVISLPIGRRTLLQRFRNVSALKVVIREKKIDVVHAHSRAASWVSFFATRGSNVPLISTIHGRQHLHFSSTALQIYGEKVLSVCESIHDHLIEDLGIAPEIVTVCRNGIDLAQWVGRDAKSFHSKYVISLVGRLSGPKGEVARMLISSVFPFVAKKVPSAEFHIVGGMKECDNYGEFISAVNNSIGAKKIFLKGFTNDVAGVYRHSSLVIGSGRVAMEALACGTPVVAVGESQCIGLVNETNATEALRTNFGDAGEKKNFSPSYVAEQIVSALLKDSPASVPWRRSFVRREFDIKQKKGEVFAHYAEAVARKKRIKEIPVLMYHRVTNEIPAKTKHHIYVTCAEFERQLRFLSRKRFSTLRFLDLRDIVEGNKVLPRKPVLLTFDDGYEDNFTYAFPLLKNYGMTATIFLIGDSSIKTNVWDSSSGEPEAKLLEDEQVRAMEEYGIEFGAHSMTHRKLTDITFSECRAEIAGSKSEIEKRTGARVVAFAYPYGAVNADIKKQVMNAGFMFGVATDSGGRNFWQDFFQVRRIPIFPKTSAFAYWKKTSGWYHRYKKVR
ncbi:MAG: polysaccharide deacetylase family protein [Bacteroidota bacterium]|nr:polysaccharide deacetylase family protein [Bacteroidota bacterium]